MTASAIRDAVLARVADHLLADRREHPTRVAIDGITAPGKTTFARELTAATTARGRSAVHLSTDDFHQVAAHRRRNPDRAVGYYRDAYDLDQFRRLVLDPLGPGGDRRYRPRSHDLDTDELLDVAAVEAARDSIVVVDGSFLQSAPLHDAWDEVVWLDASPRAALERAVQRDSMQFGGPETTRIAYAERYHAACRLYVDEVSPRERASVVVDHDDTEAPLLRRIGGPAAAACGCSPTERCSCRRCRCRRSGASCPAQPTHCRPSPRLGRDHRSRCARREQRRPAPDCPSE